MGYVEIIRDGFTLRLEDDKKTLTPSLDLCIACNDDRLIHSGNFLVCTQCHCRQQDIIMDHPRFKCNGCKRDTEFLWLDQLDTPEGFKAYQCMDCGCVGVKNVVEALHVPDEDICRCGKCGGWMFAAVACHTCSLIAAK